MKIKGVNTWRLIIMVTAYVTLLSHAFIPHHHHDDVVHFGKDGCSSTTHHAEHHPAHADPLPFSDCNTIKNVILSIHHSDESSFYQLDVPYWDLNWFAFINLLPKAIESEIHQIAYVGPEDSCLMGQHTSAKFRGPPSIV